MFTSIRKSNISIIYIILLICLGCPNSDGGQILYNTQGYRQGKLTNADEVVQHCSVWTAASRLQVSAVLCDVTAGSVVDSQTLCRARKCQNAFITILRLTTFHGAMYTYSRPLTSFRDTHAFVQMSMPKNKNSRAGDELNPISHKAT